MYQDHRRHKPHCPGTSWVNLRTYCTNQIPQYSSSCAQGHYLPLVPVTLVRAVSTPEEGLQKQTADVPKTKRI